MKDMADKLGVSASFLSSVENGKKRMPPSWNEEICHLYALNEQEVNEFTTAIAETENAIDLRLDKANQGQKELAISFARRFDGISAEQIEEIQRILSEGGGD